MMVFIKHDKCFNTAIWIELNASNPQLLLAMHGHKCPQAVCVLDFNLIAAARLKLMCVCPKKSAIDNGKKCEERRRRNMDRIAYIYFSFASNCFRARFKLKHALGAVELWSTVKLDTQLHNTGWLPVRKPVFPKQCRK